MYVPNSEIRLISNLSLDSSYTDTLYFGSKTEQSNYFYGKSTKAFTESNFIKERNIIRVGGNSTEYYNYNYLMFRNTNFTDKWFYAFINKITYLNENTTEIEYEIDVIQTWMFDMVQQDSFIEREHVKDDTLYANTVNEGFDTLPKKIVKENTLLDIGYDELSVVAYFSQDSEVINLNPPGIYGGTYIGSYVQIFSFEEFSELVVSILQRDGKIESLITAFMFDARFLEWEEVEGKRKIKTGPNIYDNHNVSIPINLDGYIPKNNKLFQFPFVYSSVVTREGTFDIHYQDMEEETQIEITIPLNPEPVGKVYMNNYRGVVLDYETGVNVVGFPLVPYNYSMYINEYNASKYSNSLFMVNQAATGIAGIVTQDVGAVTSAFSTTTNKLASVMDNFNRPQTSVNQKTGTDSYLSMSFKGLTITEQVVSIKEEYAKMMDSYFDRYGYKVMKNDKISYRNRENYTYVKTVECNFVGNFDNSTKNIIKNIFNKGVTFWVNANSIGDYSVSNLTI